MCLYRSCSLFLPGWFNACKSALVKKEYSPSLISKVSKDEALYENQTGSYT